jgi:secondary thiamine-phosphate synthase enzyme
MVHGEYVSVQASGFSDIRNITAEVQQVVAASGVSAGVAVVFVSGSTASVSTIEFEPALVEDVKEHLERTVPSTAESRHSRTWGDDNGFSHIRATTMGPGITVPVHASKLVLGTWQQIVLVDHDNRPRTRKLFVQVMGE